MGPEIHLEAGRTNVELNDPLEIPSALGPVRGRVSLSGSKSYTNRALPIAALASGRSILAGALDSDDTRYMVAALQSLGVPIDADWPRGTLTVDGQDGSFPSEQADLFLGNSGTSMRFLAALVTLGHGHYRLDGTPRMRLRPLAPLIEGLSSIGVAIRGEDVEGFPPVIVDADGLPGGTIRMRGDLSSQYFSALAMILPYAREPLAVEVVGDLVSKPYLDLTADTMQAFGVRLSHGDYHILRVELGDRYAGRRYDIEPDASAASYFFALAAVTGGSITVERLPPSSKQGDVHFVDVLERMGCRVERGTDDITVSGTGQLHGIEVDMNAISDTVQTLAAIAPFADAPVAIRNVAHIRHKETDRITALVTELRKMGARVEERADGLTVYPSDLHPTTVYTYDDHRMAMSFAITGVRAKGTRIADPGCVSKTVPEFWDVLLPLLRSSARR